MSSILMAESKEKSSSSAKAFIPTQGLPPSSLTEPIDNAESSGYAAASHHAELVSSKSSFLQRLVSQPKGGEDNEDHLADGCVVM